MVGIATQGTSRFVPLDAVPDQPDCWSGSDELERKDHIAKLLLCLPARDERIIRLHYGLWEGPPLSFAEIAEELGLSRGRVAAIHKASLRRLRIWSVRLHRRGEEALRYGVPMDRAYRERVRNGPKAKPAARARKASGSWHGATRPAHVWPTRRAGNGSYFAALITEMIAFAFSVAGVAGCVMVSFYLFTRLIAEPL